MKTTLKSFFIRHTATLLIGCLVLSVLLITCGMINSIKKNIELFGTVAPMSETDETRAVHVSIGEQYIIREYDGRIGIFISGDNQPVKVIQVYVIHLPESDRMKLRQGITVNSRSELGKLINDFSS